MEKPPREMMREARLEDFPRRLFGIVRNAAELDHLLGVVPDAVAGARVVIARLPAAADAAQVLVAVLDGQPFLEDVFHRRNQLERALQMRVPDEREVRQVARAAQHRALCWLRRGAVHEEWGVPRSGLSPA